MAALNAFHEFNVLQRADMVAPDASRISKAVFSF